MHETLLEFCDSRGAALRVDREAGVIRNVKVLGLESRNGRTYRPEALATAAALYDGAKVNVNHPKGAPQGPRDYQDRIGVLRNITLRESEGLFGDFHFNPAHTLAGQLAWDAEHAPENVGLSHNVVARVSRDGQRQIVESIERVQSVDLVADPATTRGLFEAESGPPTDEVTQLREELSRLQAAHAGAEKRELARRLLVEFKLPSPEATDPWSQTITSPTFWESLVAVADDPAMRRLLEERSRLAVTLRGAATRTPPGKPTSREQGLVEGVGTPLDAAGFAKQICT